MPHADPNGDREQFLELLRDLVTDAWSKGWDKKSSVRFDQMDKWKEVIALYDRLAERLDKLTSHFTVSGDWIEEELEKVDKTTNYVRDLRQCIDCDHFEYSGSYCNYLKGKLLHLESVSKCIYFSQEIR